MGPNYLQGQCAGDKGCVGVVHTCILPLITTHSGAINSSAAQRRKHAPLDLRSYSTCMHIHAHRRSHMQPGIYDGRNETEEV